ncbi:MAG: hypothetical protein WAK10_07215, partial [Methanoregula sp.]
KHRPVAKFFENINISNNPFPDSRSYRHNFSSSGTIERTSINSVEHKNDETVNLIAHIWFLSILQEYFISIESCEHNN